jgi:hypothetical protein
VIAEHTYRHRAIQLEEVLCVGRPAAAARREVPA